jgi:hypothetical protein
MMSNLHVCDFPPGPVPDSAPGTGQNFGRFLRIPLTPFRMTSTTLSTTFPLSFTEYISLISYKLGIFQETDSSLP